MKQRNYRKYSIDFSRLIINILIILSIFIITNIIMSYSFGKKEFKTESVTITYGDTLWKYASQICSNNNDLVIQDVVNDIKEINKLKTCSIYENQRLLLPVY